MNLKTTKKFFNLHYRITKACNLNCKHCYYNAVKGNAQELSKQDFLNSCQIIKQQDININKVVFTGGEVMCISYNKDIISLIKDFFPNSIIRVDTNGIIHSQSNKFFKYFAGVDCYHLSIDMWHGSVEQNGHSKILDEFIKNSDKYHFKIKVHWTNAPNDEEVFKKFYNNYKNQNIHISIGYLEPTGRALIIHKDLCNNDNFVYRCTLGKTIYIDCDNQWYACKGAIKWTKIDHNNLMHSYAKLMDSSSCKALLKYDFKTILDIAKKLSPELIKSILKENPCTSCNICASLLENHVYSEINV